MKNPGNKPSETEPRRHILIVDDEAPIRDILKTCLEQQGYRTSTAATGAEALRAINLIPVDLIVLDVVLEDVDGFELLLKFKKVRPRCPVIIISGLGADEEVKSRALKNGAADCVSKTSPLDQLLEAMKRTLAANPAVAEAPIPIAKTHRAPVRKSSARSAISLKVTRQVADAGTNTSASVSGNQTLTEKMATTQDSSESKAGEGESEAVSATPDEDTVSEKSKSPPEQFANVVSVTPGEVARLISIIPEAAPFEFGMEVFLRMLGAFHTNLGNTAMRSVCLCRTLGEMLQLPDQQRQNLLWAAALHDISLVQVERNLYNRWWRNPEKCSKDELALMRKHPERSQRMLAFSPVFKEAGEIIAAHHENWDGSGYPGGLKMEMIPAMARVLSPVIYYCSKHTPNEKTVSELDAHANRLFDPKSVQLLVKAAAATALPQGEREIMASDLRPGMILAGDILNWDGLLILGKGKVLNGPDITKIVHLIQTAHTESRVLVFC